jgi:type VI secretion system secreted protein VgrG
MLNVTVNLFPDSRLVALQNCVPRYELREGLSELFELTVELTLTNPAFDVKDAVGQRAEVSFSDEPFLFQVEGMVRRMRQLSAEATGVSRYELLVVSPLWLTTRRRDHRIFQDKSVVEVVAEVIQGYGGRIPDLKDLTGEHAKREYCVQYGETDYDFICRILADEGISFFFDHDQKLSATPPPSRSPSSIFTLVDDTTVFAQELETTIHFVPPAGGLQATQPHVQQRRSSSARS